MSLPYLEPIRPWAVVEIAGESGEDERARLIRAAYRSSAAGLVALALRGVTAQTVDRALDGVVDARNEDLKGVVYLDADQESQLLAAAAQAAIVIACTDNFRSRLLTHGIRSVRPGSTAALRHLPDTAAVPLHG